MIESRRSKLSHSFVAGWPRRLEYDHDLICSTTGVDTDNHNTVRTMSAANTLLRVSRRAASAASRSSNWSRRAISINSAEKGSGNAISTETTGDQKLRQPGEDLLGELRKAPRPRMLANGCIRLVLTEYLQLWESYLHQ